MDFKGLDWSELIVALGLPYDDLDADGSLNITTKYLAENIFDDKAEDIAKIIKQYLTKHYKQSLKHGKYNAPIWKALLEIDDTFTLIKYTIKLLDCMWV